MVTQNHVNDNEDRMNCVCCLSSITDEPLGLFKSQDFCPTPEITKFQMLEEALNREERQGSSGGAVSRCGACPSFCSVLRG
jgi:hypothetical protein